MAPLRMAATTAALLLCSAAASLAAQDGRAAERSTSTGAYTERQADKGGATYAKHCVACHAPAAVTGLPFRRAWTGRTAYDFFELIRTTMPQDNPGRLSRSQYTEIVAYLFRLNGFPSGDTPLPSDADALKLIRIESTPSRNDP